MEFQVSESGIFIFIREINCLFDYLSACIIILGGCCRVGVWGRFY